MKSAIGANFPYLLPTGENKKVCEVKSPKLDMGKKYTYNFLLPIDASSTIITFTTTVYNWMNGTDSNITLPNTPTMQDVRNLLAAQGDYVNGRDINWDNLFYDGMYGLITIGIRMLNSVSKETAYQRRK